MANKIDRNDLHLNYNPEAPQERFKAAVEIFQPQLFVIKNENIFIGK